MQLHKSAYGENTTNCRLPFEQTIKCYYCIIYYNTDSLLRLRRCTQKVLGQTCRMRNVLVRVLNIEAKTENCRMP